MSINRMIRNLGLSRSPAKVRTRRVSQCTKPPAKGVRSTSGGGLRKELLRLLGRLLTASKHRIRHRLCIRDGQVALQGANEGDRLFPPAGRPTSISARPRMPYCSRNSARAVWAAGGSVPLWKAPVSDSGLAAEKAAYAWASARIRWAACQRLQVHFGRCVVVQAPRHLHKQPGGQIRIAGFQFGCQPAQRVQGCVANGNQGHKEGKIMGNMTR